MNDVVAIISWSVIGVIAVVVIIRDARERRTYRRQLEDWLERRNEDGTGTGTS